MTAKRKFSSSRTTPPVVTTFQTGLEAEGYPVEAVSDTTEALTRLANGDYPIVVTDIYLDERTGLDVLRARARLQPQLLGHRDHRPTGRWKP